MKSKSPHLMHLAPQKELLFMVWHIDLSRSFSMSMYICFIYYACKYIFFCKNKKTIHFIVHFPF